MAIRFLEGVSSSAINAELARLKNETPSNFGAILWDLTNSLIKYYDRLNSAVRTLVNTDQAQTLTNKTLTSPTLTTPTVNGAKAGNTEQTKFCTTAFAATSGDTGTTLTNIVGLTGFSVAAAGVYQFEIHIAGAGTANSGMKIGWKFTTMTLTDAEYTSEGFTASAVAVQHGTTATDQPTLFGQTAAVIEVVIRGRITVNAAGTLAIQAAQNASHADTTSVAVGSYAKFEQIG